MWIGGDTLALSLLNRTKCWMHSFTSLRDREQRFRFVTSQLVVDVD